MKKICKIVANILIISLLSGCITPEEKAQLKLEQQRKIIEADNNKCIGYGFTKGTDQFSNCMMQLDISRKEEAALKKVLRCERAKQRQANKKGPSTSGWGAVLEGALDGLEVSDCD